MYFVVDWGTSRLRVSAVDAASGRVLATHALDRGIATVSAGDHAAVFREAIEEMAASTAPVAAHLESHREPFEAHVSGMATSNIGWHPTPYLRTPVDLDSLGRHCESVELDLELRGATTRWKLHFYPGARTDDDILRGEEIEALGVLHSRPGAREGPDGVTTSHGEMLLVLPGTHTKWLRLAGRTLIDFKTVPTGDLHAALHGATLLSRTLPEAPVAMEDSRLLTRFDAGLDRARERGPLTSLFAVRALAVLPDHGLAPAETSALLSGILVGGEVLERLSGEPGDTSLWIGGAPGLQRIYVRAVSRLTARRPLAVTLPEATSAAILGIQAIRESGPG